MNLLYFINNNYVISWYEANLLSVTVEKQSWRGEILRMKWEDIDWGNDRVRLWTHKRMGGTYEYDWLPMTRELRKALRWWWEHRPIKDQPHVFLCLDEKEACREYYGKPFKYRLHLMQRLCERAEVKHFGFHAIRHLSASILFNLGYDVGTIQTILRHKSPSTTEHYLKSIGLEQVREALEELKPSDAKVLEFKSPSDSDSEAVQKKKKPSEEPSAPQSAIGKGVTN